MTLGTPQRRRVAKLSFDFAVMRTVDPEHTTINHDVEPDISRCTQPINTRIMVHVPKLRPEQRTEVPELAAAAAVGAHDAATSSPKGGVMSRNCTR